ncbi:hypothetical protein [Aquimarina rhabdastrellae]
MTKKKTNERTLYRDENTGRFVSKKYATEHKNTTTKEISRRKKND